MKFMVAYTAIKRKAFIAMHICWSQSQDFCFCIFFEIYTLFTVIYILNNTKDKMHRAAMKFITIANNKHSACELFCIFIHALTRDLCPQCTF